MESVTRRMKMIDAVRLALSDAMTADDTVVLLGDAIGEGGIFGASRGLRETFGAGRVLDLPPRENGLVGVAIGLALSGLRPVVEIQLADFALAALEQVAHEAARIRYRSGGEESCPLVIRMPAGGGVAGGPLHSASPESLFATIPGLVVVAPACAQDAYGLLRAALRQDDPVVVLEPKCLYHERGDIDPDERIELATARVVRTGCDATVVVWGGLVPVAEAAAATAAAEHDLSIEVIDARSLVPLDEDTILASVRKTGRLVIAHEAPRTGGFGGEVAAIVAERAIDSLEAPILRVAGLDAPLPFALETAARPNVERILRAVEQVVDY